jgi:hypothetical protein
MIFRYVYLQIPVERIEIQFGASGINFHIRHVAVKFGEILFVADSRCGPAMRVPSCIWRADRCC